MLTLQQRIKRMCEEQKFVTFYNGYSGRSMYGRSCVGVTGTRQDCIAVIAELIKDSMNEIAAGEETYVLDRYNDEVDTLLGFQTDSMGYDTIIYWPKLEEIQSPELDEPDNG